MRTLLLAAGLVSALGHAAPPRDGAEAYRLDSLRTKALNEDSLARLAPARTAVPAAASPAPVRSAPAAPSLLEREDAAIAAWRARQAACRAGDRTSCDPS